MAWMSSINCFLFCPIFESYHTWLSRFVGARQHSPTESGYGWHYMPRFQTVLSCNTSSKPVQCLKAVDTIGNCQRLAFTVGVSQHMHKITNLWKFKLNWLSKLQEINERKNTLVTQSCVLLDAWFRDLKF